MPSWMLGGAAMATLALAPVVGILLARKKLGVRNAAAWLVTYGSVVIAGEHAYVGLAVRQELVGLTGLHDHAQFHWFMAGIYTLICAVLLTVIAWTTLRTGLPAGWFSILFALLVGGSLELFAASTIFPHGIPPESIPLGLFLYAYIPAFSSALAISFPLVFRR